MRGIGFARLAEITALASVHHAIYAATGKRVRHLPITTAQLM